MTVCFGRTGIVVPCKEGQLRVRELTQQALQRYLKTREKVGAALGARGRGGGGGAAAGWLPGSAPPPPHLPGAPRTGWRRSGDAEHLGDLICHDLWPQLLYVANMRDLGVCGPCLFQGGGWNRGTRITCGLVRTATSGARVQAHGLKICFSTSSQVIAMASEVGQALL